MEAGYLHIERESHLGFEVAHEQLCEVSHERVLSDEIRYLGLPLLLRWTKRSAREATVSLFHFDW